MTTPELPNPGDGRLALMASLRDQDTPVNPGADALPSLDGTAPTGGGAWSALPVPAPPTKTGASKECYISAHDHGPLVTLHFVECLAAELGLLARATPEGTQGLADTACGLADVPSVPVAFVWAPSRKRRKFLGWHCGEAHFPLFPYPGVIVLNRANGGDTLRTLAHELAHHVVGVRQIREGGTRPGRRYRPHSRPFPETYRELVDHVHIQVAALRELSG